jgi:hypothetical protein
MTMASVTPRVGGILSLFQKRNVLNGNVVQNRSVSNSNVVKNKRNIKYAGNNKACVVTATGS